MMEDSCWTPEPIPEAGKQWGKGRGLKVWSPDQRRQQQQHLRTCWKGELLDPKPDLLNQKLRGCGQQSEL